MKPTTHELEAISVRRAKLADAGKVRYRVYSNPTEFIAVIADSALMAVKVSGVAKPYKIMRDLPTDSVAIEAQRMAAREASNEQVTFAVAQQPRNPSALVADLPEQEEIPAPDFVPMDIKELQRKDSGRIRILSPDMVNAIIEDHAKKQAEAEPVAEAAPEAPPPPAPAPAEPEISTVDKVKQMAKEILPSAAELPEAPPEVKADPEALSPEEVEKLLNE